MNYNLDYLISILKKNLSRVEDYFKGRLIISQSDQLLFFLSLDIKDLISLLESQNDTDLSQNETFPQKKKQKK